MEISIIFLSLLLKFYPIFTQNSILCTNVIIILLIFLKLLRRLNIIINTIIHFAGNLQNQNLPEERNAM